MLIFCVSLLTLTILLGALMLAGRLRHFAWAHGASGALGLSALALTWRHAALTGKIGRDALILLAAALCGGLLIAASQWRRRPTPSLVLILHAVAGGLAYLLLAGLMFGR